MDSINRPFDDEQLDVSIDSLAKNVVFFPLYYKLVLKIYKNIRHQPRTCTFKVDVIEWPQFVSLFRVFGMTMWNAKRLSWYNQQPTTKEQLEKSFYKIVSKRDKRLRGMPSEFAAAEWNSASGPSSCTKKLLLHHTCLGGPSQLRQFLPFSSVHLTPKKNTKAGSGCISKNGDLIVVFSVAAQYLHRQVHQYEAKVTYSFAQRTSSTNINFPAKHGLSAIEVETISKRIHQMYDEISTMDPTFFETVALTDDRLEPVVEGEDVGILDLGSIGIAIITASFKQ